MERLLKGIGAFAQASEVAQERKNLILLMAQDIVNERKNPVPVIDHPPPNYYDTTAHVVVHKQDYDTMDM